MIDLTPLDVRNKRGDFKKIMRGYDPTEVDVFLELAAERLEVLVRENLQLRERTQTLQNQVDAQVGREQAVQDALVTAQELRADIQAQSQREADHITREAEAESKRIVAEAEAEARRLIAEAESEVRSRLRGIERQLDQGQSSMADLERRRARFIKEFRSLLERELDVVNVEEDRVPFEQRAIDLDLGPRAARAVGATAAASIAVPETDEAAPADEPVTDAVPASSEPAPEGSADAPDAADAPAVEAAPVSAAPVAPPASPSTMAAVPAEPAPQALPADVVAPGPPIEAAAPDSRATEEATISEGQPEPVAEIDVADLEPEVVIESAAEPTVDVAALEPEPPVLPDEPTSLELELMAGASAAADAGIREQYPDVPDLETLLAEAGVEELKPTAEQDIAPPPAPGVPPDNLILFDPNDPDRHR